MKNQLSVFMTGKDEIALSERLSAKFPHISFFENSKRLRPDFCFKENIGECADSFVWMLNRDLIPASNGRLPVNSKEWWLGLPCVQLLRCKAREEDGREALVNGRFALTGSHSPESDVGKFWKCLLAEILDSSYPVDAIDSVTNEIRRTGVPGFRVFEDASDWLAADQKRTLKGPNMKLLFLPAVPAS